jgi:predicted RNase H-like nuclease
VFPHAIAVALLGAERTLRYKKGRLAARTASLDVFRQLLGGQWSALRLPDCQDLAETIVLGSGRVLKEREDRLDAIACALAAHHAWQFGLEPGEVFGDAVNGYIAVPRRR